MATKAKTLNVVAPISRTGLDTDVLNRIARRAGFPTYQAMTIHMLTRVQSKGKEAMDGDVYSVVDETIAQVMLKVRGTRRTKQDAAP